MARNFNGTTDRIDYTNAGTLYNSALTISAWIYGDSFATIQRYILTTHTSSNTNVGVLFQVTTDSKLVFLILGSTNLSIRSATALSTGQWYHVAVTHDGSTTAANATFYINGTAVSNESPSNGSSLTSDASSTWSVGGRVFDDNRCFDGRIMGLGVWSHAKTADEITALAKGYLPTFFRRGLLWAPDLTSLARDPISNQAGTLDGTTVIDNPPRIVWPSGTRVFIPVAAGGGGSGGARRRRTLICGSR